jgi:hypothetical protein
MFNRLAFLKTFPALALLVQKPFWSFSIEKSSYKRKLIYENPLTCSADVAGFNLEGEAKLSFENGRLRMQNKLEADEGQKSNFVLWCPKKFPKNMAITWKFYPLKEPGLAMLFFAAQGKNDVNLFDKHLAKRTGEYQQYNKGDMNAFHIAYFRRRYESERAFHLCNLRKSYGANMVAQGADPIPSVVDFQYPMEMEITKYGSEIEFTINKLPVLKYIDDGNTFGPLLNEGYIGFRQMAPLIAEYWDLKVYSLT